MADSRLRTGKNLLLTGMMAGKSLQRTGRIRHRSILMMLSRILQRGFLQSPVRHRFLKHCFQHSLTAVSLSLITAMRHQCRSMAKQGAEFSLEPLQHQTIKADLQLMAVLSRKSDYLVGIMALGEALKVLHQISLLKSSLLRALCRMEMQEKRKSL